VEKPPKPKSTLASMGIYIFNYKVLREALVKDAADENSSHDFGKNIIPTLLANNNRLFVHRFDGYWKDVGTIDSLWEANMDLIEMMDEDFYQTDKHYFRLFSEDTNSVPQYIGKKAKVTNSIVNQGAIILGEVEGSIISNEVFIEVGAVVKDSVIMPGVTVGRNAYVNKAIVANDLELPEHSKYNEAGEKVLLIHEGVVQ
jgi:glucose-1-phosphate adenylyltransferase